MPRGSAQSKCGAATPGEQVGEISEEVQVLEERRARRGWRDRERDQDAVAAAQEGRATSQSPGSRRRAAGRSASPTSRRTRRTGGRGPAGASPAESARRAREDQRGRQEGEEENEGVEQHRRRWDGATARLPGRATGSEAGALSGIAAKPSTSEPVAAQTPRRISSLASSTAARSSISAMSPSRRGSPLVAARSERRPAIACSSWVGTRPREARPSAGRARRGGRGRAWRSGGGARSGSRSRPGGSGRHRARRARSRRRAHARRRPLARPRGRSCGPRSSAVRRRRTPVLGQQSGCRRTSGNRSEGTSRDRIGPTFRPAWLSVGKQPGRTCRVGIEGLAQSVRRLCALRKKSIKSKALTK